MQDLLRFHADEYVTVTRQVDTNSGPHTIEYRNYQHILYVSRPVDKSYQSMDIWVPVSIDGKDYDASDAPILFVIGVGGYMSSSNYGHPGRPDGPGGPDSSNGGPDRKPGGPGSKAAGGGYLGLGGENGPGDAKDLALYHGFVVVQPGCRGRDNQFPDGTFYGKAPAAIVDLKAAVRYLRYNSDLIPGNTEAIFSTGGSAGGALSCLLAASGNAPEYEPYLDSIGAAKARDDILGSASYSPIIDLEHADGAYEWQYGSVPCQGTHGGPMGDIPAGLVDQALSRELADMFEDYLDSLALSGMDGFGVLDRDNYQEYLMDRFLIPAANACWAESTPSQQAQYLLDHPWFTVDERGCHFTFDAFLRHCGRMKALPAFDDFEKRMAETDLFGTETVKCRHFTQFSLEHDAEEEQTELSPDLQAVIKMMNPMTFVLDKHPGCAKYWWIRHGACDKDTSLPVIVNFATALAQNGKHVNVRLIWDGGHCADDDTESFMVWASEIAM